MSLIDGVKHACDRLGVHGWRDMLLRITGGKLDIQQATTNALEQALATELNVIDRSFPGFVDFAVDSRRAITPGSPGRSLLYHALASPGVVTGTNGPLEAFPTLQEIEAVENYVFGVGPPTLADLKQRSGLAAEESFSIVVFAYEYRPACDTCSRLQADVAFSRTGVSRVGTRSLIYDPRVRGFQSEVPDDPFAFAVCPAHYAPFLAVKRAGSQLPSTPMHAQDGDDAATFWIPVHKLFDGPECIKGFDLKIDFQSFHYNDKIRRIHATVLKNPVPATKPFQFQDGIAEFSEGQDLCRGLLVPAIHAGLVEPAVLNGKFVTFRVPASQSQFAAFEPGAQTDPDTGAEIRPAPAYVHARSQVTPQGVHDLGDDPARPDVRANVRRGDYDALHYVDFTGDGQIDVNVEGLAGAAEVEPNTVPAYSLVAAPDFFPSAGQRALTEWTESTEVPRSLQEKIWGVPPAPLCDTRLPANLQMPNNRFDPLETTVTAIVSLLGPPPAAAAQPISVRSERHSCLPDDAAGVFAPGWDVSTDKNDARVHHLAAYGLGSPFPEDSKLCAALSTFWATVAPDITRGMSINTGNADLRHTVAPLTDDEIGQTGTLPWDGNPGPVVVTSGGQRMLECASFLHVDYVRNALEGRFTSRLTARITSDEYKRRVLAMAFVYAVIGDDPNGWFVLSFQAVAAGDDELQRAQMDASVVLPGAVYRFDLFRADPATEQVSPSDFRKRLLPIRDRRFFLVDPQNRLVLQRKETQTIWARARLNISH